MDSVKKRNDITKYPLKRFDIVLRKFIEVAIPLHLELLKRHQENITNFQVSEQWDRVHSEQVNASRTVQQLKADIWEVDKVREQLLDDDLIRYDKKIVPVKKQAHEAIQEFLGHHNAVLDPTRLLFREPSSCCIQDADHDVSGYDDILSEKLDDQQLRLQRLPQNSSAVESWTSLHKDLLSLNQMVHDFNETVNKQQPAISNIEENLDESLSNIQDGTNDLIKSTRYKTFLYPATGAAIGCLAGGPAGLLLGLKVGALAAVGGGIVGYHGGRYLKHRTVENADIEMISISKHNAEGSLSLPELSAVGSSRPK